MEPDIRHARSGGVAISYQVIGDGEVHEGKVAGIAVSVGARVAARAEPGDVLVSQTVKDLVSGSSLSFTERGEHELKGIPGTWRLYAVLDPPPSN